MTSSSAKHTHTQSVTDIVVMSQLMLGLTTSVWDDGSDR